MALVKVYGTGDAAPAMGRGRSGTQRRTSRIEWRQAITPSGDGSRPSDVSTSSAWPFLDQRESVNG